MHFDNIQSCFAALFYMQLADLNPYKVQCPANILQLSDVVSKGIDISSKPVVVGLITKFYHMVVPY